MSNTYKTFKRSAINWEEFVTARKTVVDTGLTKKEARKRCWDFNYHRSPRQIRRGTKLEYTEE